MGITPLLLIIGVYAFFQLYMLLKNSKKVFPLPTWRSSYAERGQSKQLAVCCLFNPTLFAFQKQGGNVIICLSQTVLAGVCQ